MSISKVKMLKLESDVLIPEMDYILPDIRKKKSVAMKKMSQAAMLEDESRRWMSEFEVQKLKAAMFEVECRRGMMEFEMQKSKIAIKEVETGKWKSEFEMWRWMADMEMTAAEKCQSHAEPLKISEIEV